MSSRYEDDCLALLTYVANHREEYLEGRQTQKKLGESIGLSQQQISYIITSVDKIWRRNYNSTGENGSVLFITAEKYGFKIKLTRKKGRILDAVYVGRARDIN